MDPRDKIELKNGTIVTARGTFARADQIDVSGGSVASVQIHSPANVILPPFEYNPYCSQGDNITIPNGAIITLTGSIYKTIIIGKSCTVTFTQKDLYVLNLYVKENSTVKFADCTKIRICKKLDLASKVVFNPDASEVIVYAKDGVDIGAGCKVTSDIYCLSGRLSVAKATASIPTTMKGLFIANNVHAKDYVYWYTNPDCHANCRLVTPPVAAREEAPENETEGLTINSSLDEQVQMKAYPNPFSNLLNIEFSLPETSHAVLEVYSISGQRIQVLFDGKAEADNPYRVQYHPENVASGLIIYRLQTDKGTYFGKAVIVK